MEGLWSDLKSWQDTFTKGLEQFGGEVLHERQQEIKQLRALVSAHEVEYREWLFLQQYAVSIPQVHVLHVLSLPLAAIFKNV